MAKLPAALVLCISLFACDSSAGVPAPAPVAVAAPTATALPELKIDKAKSSVGGKGAKITAEAPFTFSRFDGGVSLDGERLSSVRFTVDTASIDAEIPRLTAHLKTEDFLSAEAFPQATFRSTSISMPIDGSSQVQVEGILSIRGREKSIRFPARVAVLQKEVRAAAEVTIDRRDFGVVYPGMADDLIQNDVVLRIGLVAPR